MAKKQPQTPTEYAYETALTALYNRFNNLPHNTVQERAIRAAVAKLHNRLLEQSGMDGLAIYDGGAR